MKNKLFKKIIALGIMCGICVSVVLPVNAAEAGSVFSKKVTTFSDIAPYTLYLQSGEITYQKLNSTTMRVLVKTNANRSVSSIYHDVVIYKNGTEVFRDRLSRSSDVQLTSNIDIPASNGDFFSTYVVHYVSHNGYTEHCDSHDDQYFY